MRLSCPTFLRGRHEWLSAGVQNQRQKAVAADRSSVSGSDGESALMAQEGWNSGGGAPRYSASKCTGMNWHNPEFEKVREIRRTFSI